MHQLTTATDCLSKFIYIRNREMYVDVKNYHARGLYPLDRIRDCSISPYPGVYVVQGQCHLTGEMKVVDVGQTKNLQERFKLYHPRMDCWRSQGVSNLSVAVIYQINYKSRIRMENDLREHFKPPCWWNYKKINCEEAS